jgi:hypothetical protein
MTALLDWAIAASYYDLHSISSHWHLSFIDHFKRLPEFAD